MPDPTTPKVDACGFTVTQAGYAWEERMMDGEYVAALHGAEDNHEPYEDDDDDRYYERDYYSGHEDEDEDEDEDEEEEE